VRRARAQLGIVALVGSVAGSASGTWGSGAAHRRQGRVLPKQCQVPDILALVRHQEREYTQHDAGVERFLSYRWFKVRTILLPLLVKPFELNPGVRIFGSADLNETIEGLVVVFDYLCVVRTKCPAVRVA
jgi:hypothetical protein